MDILHLLTDVELVIFDLGGVLYQIDFQRTRSAFKNLAGYNGVDVAFGVDVQDDIFLRADRGELDGAAFYAALRNRFGFTCTDAEIDAAWCAILIAPYANAAQWVRSVAVHRPVALLSNISGPHLRHVAHHIEDIVAACTAAFFSCRIGLRKPDVAAFQHVIAAMGARAETTLLIDDSSANCAAAKSLGMQTLHLTREE